MTENPHERPPMAEALEWVSRIITVAVVMVGPGIGGHLLDQQLGTKYLVIVGFVIGLPCGMFYLLAITRVIPGSSGRKASGDPEPRETSEREQDRED